MCGPQVRKSRRRKRAKRWRVRALTARERRMQAQRAIEAGCTGVDPTVAVEHRISVHTYGP